MRRTLYLLILGVVILLAGCQGGDTEPTTPPPTAPQNSPTATPISIEVTVEATPEVVVREPTGDPQPTVGVKVTVIPAQVSFDSEVQPADPTDVLFLRPGGGETEFVIGMATVELWAAERDASGERLITTYNPAQPAWLGFTLSPDRRYVAVSDTPGAVVIDLREAEKITLMEASAPDEWAGQFVWTLDSETIYYALHDMRTGQVTLWRQTVNPLGEPEQLQGNFTMEGTALYPHLALPDGRLLMAAGSTEDFFDRAVYDPEGGELTALDLTDFEFLWAVDILADTGLVVWQAQTPENEAGMLTLYASQIGLDGRLTGMQAISTAGYGPSHFLPDGRVVSLRYGDEAEDNRFVMLTPGAQGALYTEQVLELPEEGGVNTGLEVLDADTLLLTRDVPPELWVYTISTGQALGVVDIFGSRD